MWDNIYVILFSNFTMYTYFKASSCTPQDCRNLICQLKFKMKTVNTDFYTMIACTQVFCENKPFEYFYPLVYKIYS